MTKKHKMQRKNELLVWVRRNRRALRQAGLSSAEVQILEECVLQARGQRMRKLRGSYLANALGVSRQWANTLLRRLEALNLIVRFKTGLVYLIPENISKIKGAAVKQVRRQRSKWLKRMAKLESGNSGVPKGYILVKSGRENPKGWQPSAENGATPDEIEAYWFDQMGLAND